MPSRPRSHQLETESRRAFANSLPSAWVFRDVTPDYGLDGLIEIFTDTGRATGKLFLVQLKATDTMSETFRIRVPLKTAAYYETLLIPVLIVLFHGPARRLYAQWAPRVSEVNSTTKGRSSVSILFNIGHLWNSRRFRGVVQRLRNVKRMADWGERNAKIKRYYAAKRRVKPWEKATGRIKTAPELRPGDQVFHAAFGYGTVDEVSDYYVFLHFEDEEFSRRFLPGDLPELIPVRRRERARPNKGLQPAAAGARMSRRG